MESAITVASILKTKFINSISDVRDIWLETVPNITTDEEDFQIILSSIKAGLITFESNDDVVNIENKSKKIQTEPLKPLKRSIKQDDFKAITQSTDGMSAIDSYSSISPTFSRRVADEMANHILDQVDKIIETNKLKRTIDCGEKQYVNNNVVSSPPVKSRRTSKKQSVSNSHDEIECNAKQNIVEINEKIINNQNFINNCKLSIMLKRLEDQEIDNLLIGKNRNVLKRNSEVCFPEQHFSTDSKIAIRGKSFETLKTETASNDLNQMPFSLFHKQQPNFNINKDDFLKQKDTFVKPKVGDKIKNGAILKVSEKGTEQNEQTYNNDLLTARTRTDSLNANENNTEHDINNEKKSLDKPQNDSWSIKSRTKIIKKEVVQSREPVKEVEKQNTFCENEMDMENNIHEPNWRSRTKTIRKHSIHDNTENKENNILNVNVSNGLQLNLQEQIEIVQKHNKKPISHYPTSASGKGNLDQVVQLKKVNCKENQLVEKRITRATRNDTEKKNLLLKTSIQDIKQSRNVPCTKLNINKLQTPEKVCRTPLATYNRITPCTNSALKALTGKTGINFMTRQYKVERKSDVHVKRHEEADKKIKEKQKIKYKVKDEIAKKKKEYTLRANAANARQKRQEKLQRVAAAKEAAESEKGTLAVKAKRKIEDKIKQIPDSKEKQNGKLKNKVAMQPTKSEEIRRKQEEDACLAKLKKLEEEHNKHIASEREKEMALKQLATNADMEKVMHAKVVVEKLSGFNGKCKQQEETATPGNPKSAEQEVLSYDVTPARGERKLLKPKTETDYGIDDAQPDDSSDDERHPKKILPLWAQSQNRDYLLSVNNFLPKKIWSFFMKNDDYPDVKKIFNCNPIRKRTSSVNWDPPTNYLHFKKK